MSQADALGAQLLETLKQDHPAFRIFAARRERRRFFDTNLFGEPAWDMLLLLCCAADSGTAIGETVLTGASGVPVPVARRWLSVLQNEGLLVRRHDHENIFFQTVELTEAGRSRMEAYLKELDQKS